MEPKETPPRLAQVKQNVPARVQARARADQRLHSMTVGAVAIGFAATGVFAYAAAITYTGTTTTANAADPQSAGGQPQTFSGSDDGTSGQSGTQGGGVNPYSVNQQPNSVNQQPISPPTITHHRSHAVSGGS
jgi:hypothetical protein